MPHAMTAPHDSLHGINDWKAGAWAGVIAGVVFMMLEMVHGLDVHGPEPVAPPHMIAAMVLGKDVLPPPQAWAPFDTTVMMVAMVVHFALSIVYGLAGAWLVHRFDWTGALMIGAAFGLAIYVVNFYFIAPAAFPWFTMARNGVSVFAHVMFGAVLGLAYVWLRNRRAPLMGGEARG